MRERLQEINSNCSSINNSSINNSNSRSSSLIRENSTWRKSVWPEKNDREKDMRFLEEVLPAMITRLRNLHRRRLPMNDCALCVLIGEGRRQKMDHRSWRRRGRFLVSS